MSTNLQFGTLFHLTGSSCLFAIFLLSLYADSVHVASWGTVNIHHETVQMTLAIPGSTLRKTLGLSKLAHDYYLKVSAQTHNYSLY